jgi:hypothetical protein
LLYHQLLYIGPGMDGGTISLVIAFLISFFTFIISIIWYPIKKSINFVKRMFGKDVPDNSSGEDPLPEEKV